MVEKIHTARLADELDKRKRLRQEAIRVEYVEHILRRVHPSVVPFMPPLNKIHALFDDARALIEPDGPVTDELRSSIRDTLPAGLPALQHFIDERGRAFRQALPAAWLPAQHAAFPQTEPVTTPEQLSIAQFADLDRAAYVTRCVARQGYARRTKVWIHFGLDALAHCCHRDYEGNARQVTGLAVDQTCHDTVAHICTISGLSAETATPLDLDRLDQAFVCVNCPRDTGGAIFMTWRDAVRK